MKTADKAIPIVKATQIHLGNLTNIPKKRMVIATPKPTIPTIGFGIPNSEACHEAITGEHERRGFIEQDGMCCGLASTASFSTVMIVAEMNEMTARISGASNRLNEISMIEGLSGITLSVTCKCRFRLLRSPLPCHSKNKLFQSGCIPSCARGYRKLFRHYQHSYWKPNFLYCKSI